MDDRDAQGKPIINPEKAADTPALFVIHNGVRLESRYGFASEYQTMMRAVDGLSAAGRRRISSVFCDSKASHSYDVSGCPTLADLLQFETGCIDAEGGHNGICAGKLWLDPNWLEDQPE